MALASLDVWARLLFTAGAWRQIRPRYWPRVALGLATSTVGTLLTLPERLGWAAASTVAKRLRQNPSKPAASTDGIILFVLGYYRSGTTHLHYLLSCDPQFVTPRWYQVMAPSGWWGSWTIIRWLLVPFLSSTRPQDDVAIGPEWPAEDDFASNNTALACTLPARMVVPGDRFWRHYSRFQTLEGLTPAELARFRCSLVNFVRRLTCRPLGGGLGGKGRWPQAVLLKSPAHTARALELAKLFGPERVRFIHLSRSPGPVLRSNISMHHRLEPYLLMELPGDDTLRARIIEEYGRTERTFLADREALRKLGQTESEVGRHATLVSMLRYEDLVSDPLGQLRRCYDELGIVWTQEFQRRAAGYLASVADYRTASEKSPTGTAAAPPSDTPIELAWMLEAFGHLHAVRPVSHPMRSEPADHAPLDGMQSTHTPTPTLHDRRDAGMQGVLAAFVTACIAVALWLIVAALTSDRMDWLIWPVGVMVGIAAVRASRSGSARLGLLALVCTLSAMLVVAFPATAMTAEYRGATPPDWNYVWLSTRRGVTAENNIVWVVLGLMSAYRFASRKHIYPPGMGD